MNPDCRDGKHRSCAGDGWDEVKDAQALCPCECHAMTDSQVEFVAGLLGITVEEALDSMTKILNLPDLRPPKPASLLTKRRAALAAKEARGMGPPSSGSWRGKERTTKYRSH